MDLKTNYGFARVTVSYYLKNREGALLFEKSITTKQNFYREVKGALDAPSVLKDTLDDLDAALLENVLKFYGCFIEHERFGK